MKIFKKIWTPFRIILNLVLISCIAFSLVYVLDNFLYNEDVHYGKDFRNLPEDSLDYVVLGSSHAQYSFIPSVVYEKTGLYGYVLGSACQPLEVSYEMLKYACKTQSPKLVILEAYTALPSSDGCHDDSCYVIAEYKMTGQEKINTINYLEREKASQYYIDFFSYHNNWRKEGFFNTIKKPRYLSNNVDYASGYLQIDYEFNGEEPNWWYPLYDTNATYDVELREKDLNSLNNIKKYCDDNGIELVMYKSPMDGMDDENLSYLLAVEKWASNNNVNFIDIQKASRDLGYYMVVHSSAFHAYLTGATMVSNYIADSIKDMNIVFNHKDNNALNNVYRDHYEEAISYYIYSEPNADQYLKYISDSTGYMLLRYNPINHKANEKLKEKLINLGFTNFDSNVPYYGIVKDKELIAGGPNATVDEMEIEGRYIRVDENGIIIDEDIFSDDYSDIEFVYADSKFKYYLNRNITIYEKYAWTSYKPIYLRDWE